MLVLTRKKNEAILLDGVIRVEVAALARSTVRLRFTAPRNLQLSRGVSGRDSRLRAEGTGFENHLGLEVFHATLVNQQVLPLGDAITVGVLDADKSRVLLFVNAPQGTTITTLEQVSRTAKANSSRQNLLQFMRANADLPDALESLPCQPGPKASPPAPEAEPPDPTILPFPANSARRARG